VQIEDVIKENWTLQETIDGLRTENEHLKKMLEEVTTELKAQKKVNESLNDSVAELQLEVTCCETYKAVYYELLDKLIAAQVGHGPEDLLPP